MAYDFISSTTYQVINETTQWIDVSMKMNEFAHIFKITCQVSTE